MSLYDITLGQYAPRNSICHQLDPRTKLAIFSFFTFLTLFVDRFLLLGFLGLVCMALFFLSSLSFVLLLRNLRAFLWLFVLTIALHAFFTSGHTLVQIPWINLSISKQGIENGVFYTFRIALFILFANWFTLTTSPMEFTDAMEKIFRPLQKLRIPVHEMALMTSIAIRFIPIFIEEIQRIQKAQMARGANIERGIWNRIRGLVVPILIPLFFSAFRKANELALAMDARCYRGGTSRTSFQKFQFQIRDGLFFIAMGFVAIGWIFWEK